MNPRRADRAGERITSANIKSKIAFLKNFEAVIRKDASYYEKINPALKEQEKNKFLTVINEIRKKEIEILEKTEKSLITTVSLIVDGDIILPVSNFIETQSMASHVALGEVAHQLNTSIEVGRKEYEKNQKLIQSMEFALEIIKKTAAELKGVEYTIQEFKDGVPDQKHVLFLKGEIVPSEVFDLVKSKNIAAIVTTTAGPTSHWVLAAKALNIPVFFVLNKSGEEKNKEYLKIDDIWKSMELGDLVLVDGRRGTLTLKPDLRTIERHKQKVLHNKALQKYYKAIQTQPAQIGRRKGMDDGKIVNVFTNVDAKDSLISALESGADGVGLVRTELWINTKTPYLKEFVNDKTDSIAHRELRKFFKQRVETLIRHSRGKPITFRTFDVSDDKKIPYADDYTETGFDFYRTEIGNRLLILELEAFFEAIAVQNAENVKIMFPQVNTVQDKVDGNACAMKAMENVVKRGEATLIGDGEKTFNRETMLKLFDAVPIGSMIESVEAIKNIEEISWFSDFISIGTNDLTRDIFKFLEKALGLKNLRLSIRAILLFSEIQPKVVQAINDILSGVSKIQKEKNRKIPVTICGESASQREYILHIIYASEIYDVDVAPSITYPEIAETKEFIRNFGNQGLKNVFEIVDEKLKERAQNKVEEVEQRIEDLPVVQDMVREILEQASGFQNEFSSRVEEADIQTIEVKVVNTLGMHDRTVRDIIELKNKHNVGLLIEHKGKGHEIKGVIDLFLLGITKGFDIRIVATGENRDMFVREIMELKDFSVEAKNGEKVFSEITPAEKQRIIDMKSQQETHASEEVIPDKILEGARRLTETIEELTKLDEEPKVPAEEEMIRDFSAETKEFDFIACIPEHIYLLLSEEISALEKETGFHLVPLKAVKKPAMIREMNKKTAGVSAITILLDVDSETTSAEEIKNLLKKSKEQVIGDVVSYLEIGKIRGILDCIAKDLPQGRSFQLSKKSAYEIQMTNVYNIHRKEYSENLNRYLASDLKKETKPRYMVTAVDNAFDLKLLAKSIKERRDVIDFNKTQKDPIKTSLLCGMTK
ncbi:MAG: HPr family phosphocarrier protein [Candidatus Omnitrophica bacterium]|nr:HPr family phosphocarrier protein [Candidatus Omnitrophota bacterium]